MREFNWKYKHMKVNKQIFFSNLFNANEVESMTGHYFIEIDS